MPASSPPDSAVAEASASYARGAGNGNTTERIVKKLWSYCQILRDDGLSYQDYLEQLTFLLFLKMADERAEITGKKEPIPKGYRWDDLSNPKMAGVQPEQTPENPGRLTQTGRCSEICSGAALISTATKRYRPTEPRIRMHRVSSPINPYRKVTI